MMSTIWGHKMQIKNYDQTQYLQFKSRYDLHYRKRVKFDYLSVNKIEFEEEINKVIQTMQDNKQTINLARLVKLEYLEIINTTNKVKGFEKLAKLKTLILNKYSPKSKDFTEFDLPELVSLELVSPNIHSLDGFDKMPNILCFTLFRAPNSHILMQLVI